MRKLDTSTGFGRYTFYDCEFFGIFAPDSETFRPTNWGKRAYSSEQFHVERASRKVTPETVAGWGILEGLLSAFDDSVTILDVGGYIGTFCIPTALCCAEKGIEVKSIQSFEPGPTHELLKINIDINELSDQITVHHAAMSSFDGYTKYRFRSGGSIGGAVFGNDDSDTMERIAPCFTIDGFCNGLEDQDGPMLVKLDTQGHEGKIMNRARKLISQKRAVWLIEFIAWTARSEIDDGRFADLLTNEFYVFEEHKEITSETMDAFIDEVDARPHRMADLILIPRDAPFTQKMLASIKEAS